MSMLNWQWQTLRPYPWHSPCYDRGSEREPKVGSSQAEFNDGELVRPFTDLCPPFAHGLALKNQKQPMGSYSSSPGQADMVPWTLCKILNTNLASRASSEKETDLLCSQPRKEKVG